MKRLLHALFKPFRPFTHWLLTLVLPSHIKRILFNTTLFIHLGRVPAGDTGVLARFNQALELAKYEDALKLPAKMHRLIWSGETIEQSLCQACGGDMLCQILSPEVAKRTCENIVECTPKWMQYGRREDMLKDVMKVMVVSREIPPQPQAA